MAIDYKTLPAQWKKAKPLTMGATGVGAVLKNVTGFNWKNIKDIQDAAEWTSEFDVVMKGLNKAMEKEPIQSNAKTKKWVETVYREIRRDANVLNLIRAGLQVYDAGLKKWVSASEAQEKSVDQLALVKAVWPKLKPETRKQIVELTKRG